MVLRQINSENSSKTTVCKPYLIRQMAARTVGHSVGGSNRKIERTTFRTISVCDVI